MPQSKTFSLTALVVDDEKLAREGLALRLKALGSVDILKQCENGRAALRAIAECEPDVVFLDIQMPGISGFDLVSQMQGDAMPMVVFVTAFDAFAVNAFQVHAVQVCPVKCVFVKMPFGSVLFRVFLTKCVQCICRLC